MANLRGRDRLIVALDVPTHERAFELIDTLDNVSTFKVGLELFLAGDLLGFVRRLRDRRAGGGGLFVDLKLAGDIDTTIARFVEGCLAAGVSFLTLVEAAPRAITVATLRAARRARGPARNPRFLAVPLLSSLGADDLRAVGIEADPTAYILDRGRQMLHDGCDGLIVSGDAIKACREAFGPGVDLVSPGIRPAWAAADDHTRLTTPAQAIRSGADYLVVGRPITRARDPRDAAQRVIDEIDAALDEGHSSPAVHAAGRSSA
ncbi:MAG TPA: orotidine-5'-phosphate decarboxylase [Vicinamibacterales bacterium]|nr:orotidine-5'-phosphate decarboxylase [Vicinamibacterales bacterium]